MNGRGNGHGLERRRHDVVEPRLTRSSRRRLGASRPQALQPVPADRSVRASLRFGGWGLPPRPGSVCSVLRAVARSRGSPGLTGRTTGRIQLKNPTLDRNPNDRSAGKSLLGRSWASREADQRHASRNESHRHSPNTTRRSTSSSSGRRRGRHLASGFPRDRGTLCRLSHTSSAFRSTASRPPAPDPPRFSRRASSSRTDGSPVLGGTVLYAVLGAGGRRRSTSCRGRLGVGGPIPASASSTVSRRIVASYSDPPPSPRTRAQPRTILFPEYTAVRRSRVC